jgi:hypothetical protein
MPAPDPKPFTVHVDPDTVALQDLAAAVSAAAVATGRGRPVAAPDVDEHHGAADGARLAVRARQQAERARAGRAAAGKSRYAFRRS